MNNYSYITTNHPKFQSNRARPYSPAWFAKLRTINPRQAALSLHVFQRAGRTDVCGVCGDHGAKAHVRDYRWNDQPDGLTARLCVDCKNIQEAMYARAGEALIPVGEKE